jgi:outer membrane biosynthesis protein TonB
MKTWFFSLTRAKQIVFSVLTAHTLCVLLLLINHMWTTKRTQNTFTVHTVRLTPALQQPPVVATASTQRPVAAVSGPSPTKKPTSAPTKKTTSIPKTKPSLKPTAPTPTQAAQPAPISAPKPTLTVPVLSLPSPSSSSTSSTTTTTSSSSSPTETIGAFLRDCLELPEFGEVKLRLTLDKSGRLLDLEILEAKSEKNAQFLKNRLPELEFPWLNENTTVTIVFRNV